MASEQLHATRAIVKRRRPLPAVAVLARYSDLFVLVQCGSNGLHGQLEFAAAVEILFRSATARCQPLVEVRDGQCQSLVEFHDRFPAEGRGRKGDIGLALFWVVRRKWQVFNGRA